MSCLRSRSAASALIALSMLGCGGSDNSAGPPSDTLSDAASAHLAGHDDAAAPSPGIDAAVVDSGARGDASSIPTSLDASDAPTDASVSGIDPAELEMLRQTCVDTINMYRSSIDVAALARATAAEEVCSDEGAQKDGIAKVAHGSAGNGNPCWSKAMPKFPGFNAQDTCPGYAVGGKRGSVTIADALKGCLKSMWNEGIPDGGIDKCVSDYFAGNTACYEAHGHYINMSNPKATRVSCGFYDMGNSTYWMNQDFQ